MNAKQPRKLSEEGELLLMCICDDNILDKEVLALSLWADPIFELLDLHLIEHQGKLGRAEDRADRGRAGPCSEARNGAHQVSRRMREAIAHIDAGKPSPEDMQRQVDDEAPLCGELRSILVGELMAFQDKVGPGRAPQVALTTLTMLAAQLASQSDLDEEEFAAFCAATYRTIRS